MYGYHYTGQLSDMFALYQITSFILEWYTLTALLIKPEKFITQSPFFTAHQSLFSTRLVHVNAISLDITATLENQSMPSGDAEHIMLMKAQKIVVFKKLKNLNQNVCYGTLKCFYLQEIEHNGCLFIPHESPDSFLKQLLNKRKWRFNFNNKSWY